MCPAGRWGLEQLAPYELAFEDSFPITTAMLADRTGRPVPLVQDAAFVSEMLA
jgi:hypothetical protein